MDAVQHMVDLIDKGWRAAAVDGKRVHMPAKSQFAHKRVPLFN